MRLLLLLVGFISFTSFSQEVQLKGRVVDDSGAPIFGATVILKKGSVGKMTNKNGDFTIKGKFEGEYTLEVSYIGFQTYREVLVLKKGKEYYKKITLKTGYNLDEVSISAKSKIQKIEALAYNVDVIDAKKLHKTTLDVGHALDRVSGIRIRESGGVGSDMSLSMNGFRGNQVKLFIDGIPMEHFGSSFQINNIPIGLANRIEVYKGVVPINLGADALGGAINVVTNTYEKDNLDLSYSYGSFNTHRTNISATHVTNSDFVFHINAFQNYSDNNYKILAEVNQNGNGFEEKKVKRFNDEYHNETFIGKVGVVNKTFADELLFGITLGQNYKEIQTGARQIAVYGGRHSKGNTIMPSISYKKQNFLIPDLDVKANANYNFGKEKYIDTLSRRYNWLGEYTVTSRGGELNYQHLQLQDNNGIATLSAAYEINKNHRIAINNVYTTFNRKQENLLNEKDEVDFDQPQKTHKNIAGFSYTYEGGDWNMLGFVKNYNQVINYSERREKNNSTDTYYQKMDRSENYFGYGAAVTYFFNDNVQIKASYEKSYRLASAIELFGDANIIAGNIDLKPENSDNYNLGGSYWLNLTKAHTLNLEANVFFRDANDFIRKRLNINQSENIYENVAAMNNYGVEAQLRYNYKNKLSLTANITHQELRNNNPESIFYRSRIPNMPFTYGNANATYTIHHVFGENQTLSLGYDFLYVHDFYLYWPEAGAKSDGKYGVPQQTAHGFNASLTLDHFQFTLECRNIFDELLYDNFSLQKPGRSFSAKIRYTL
ncbi:TonB-dependent receptor [Zunongwangia sp.]|uniref:TonB-dependent receptor n=1 Tax=Zunongwangia sp. TaxID=1965325 RepID=UPI003AA83671